MKKIFSFIIAAIMLMTMTAPAISAVAVPPAEFIAATSTATPTLYMTNSSAKAGQTLEMDVSVRDNPGIVAVNIKFDYPKEVLEPVGFTDGLMEVTGTNTSDGTVLAEATDINTDVANDGALFTVTFRVKDGATAQDCTVGLNVISANNTTPAYVTFATQSGTATVAGEDSTEYNIEVLNGKAFDSAGNEIFKAVPGTVVTVVAQEYEACAFDGWFDHDVTIGKVTTGIVFADANSATTTFIMPARDVTPFSLSVPVVDSITLDKTAITLPVGGKTKITSTVVPAIHNGNVTWTSSNEAVATVERFGYGEVEAKSVGTAIITATVGRKSVTCTVTVVDDKIVTIPTAVPGLVYTSFEQQGVPDGGVSYTLTGHKQTNAGTYTATATLNPGYKWSDGTTGPKTITWSIAIKKVSAPIIEIWGTYLYTGSAIIPNYRVMDEEHFKSIPAEEYDISVTDNINAGIGKITISNKKNKENANYEIGTAVQTFIIGKGTQAKPTGVIGIAPTATGASDGKITGVTVAMEYRKAGEAAWTKVTGTEITGLSAGNYEIRFAENANFGASEATAVMVAVHAHSFGTDWKNDEVEHWHECACGAKSDEAAHTGGTATCKEKAACSVCGEAYGEFAAHKYETTWSSDGVKHWHRCSVCGEKKDEAPHNFGDWKITKAATETTKGEKERVCSACSFKETAEIPVLGHTHSFGTEWEKDGTRHWHECACGAKSDEAAHTGGTATCKEKATCSVCGEAYGEIESHDFTKQDTDSTYLKSGATCTARAVYYYSCTVCSEKGDTTFEYGEKLPHSLGDWREVKAATETAVGTRERTCSVCGYKETEEIPALGHTHGFGTEWESDEANHWHECPCGEKSDNAAHSFEWKTDKEATATVAGSKHEECVVCGYKKEAVTIDPTGLKTETDTDTDADADTDTSTLTGGTGGTSDIPKDSGNSAVPIAIIVVVALGGAGAAVYFTKRKNRRKA